MAPKSVETPGSARTQSVYLEREGERQIERIATAVERVPWGVTLLQLAWTAGPVTFIGAVGGYFLGFGKVLPKENLVFFIGYTVITGVIGIATTLLYDARKARKQQAHSRALSTVIDRLPELIYAVRDLAMSTLDHDARKREAAGFLLRHGELGPEGVRLAVEEITGNAWLAETAGRMEIFRRHGMQQRVQDLIALSAPQAESALEELRATAPEIAQVLRERLSGRVPSLKEGVPRERDFIERILAAIEEENEALMTLRDVEEMLVLLFELINGREIPVLAFRYRGRWDLARATDALERERSRYRIVQATGYSRLKALVNFLAERHDTRLSDTSSGMQTALLLELAKDTLEELSNRVNTLRKEVWSGQLGRIGAFREQVAILQTALEIYDSIEEAYARMGRQHAALIRARQRWDQVAARRHKATSLDTRRHWRGGLSIFESRVCLSDEAKVEIAETLARRCIELDLRRRRAGRRRSGNNGGNYRPLTIDSAKRLAIEVALALDPHVGITRPELQRAINSSHAALIRSIEPGMSGASKAAVGAAMVAEVQERVGEAAENLAAALVTHYGVELDEEAIGFLSDCYEANPEVLKSIARLASPEGATPPVCRLEVRPPLIPPPDIAWQRQLRKAQNLLERIGDQTEEYYGRVAYR